MSHLRPEAVAALRRRFCRRGRHRYGPAQHVGAGILRQVCDNCGSVTIDLTDATAIDDEMHSPADRVGR